MALCALALSLAMAPAAFAAESSQGSASSVCYPTAVTRSEDGTERYTAVATYSGSTTSTYVKGYTVTADYPATVSPRSGHVLSYAAIIGAYPLAASRINSLY
jgi:hypothetical protein